MKKKSTENYKGDPYITTLLSTSLWSFYGLLKPGGLLVVTVNGAGVVFQLVYVALFLAYAPKNIKVKTARSIVVLNVGFLGSVILVTLLAMHENLRLTFAGILCAVFTIGMYASPLSVMRAVVKTKSVKYMPFLLSFFLFFNAVVWSVYAILVKDIYIGVPNSIGFLLGSVQLILYAAYENKSTSTESTVEMEEEGSVRLMKGTMEMGASGDDGDEAHLKNRGLSKGMSLPKPQINRENSLKGIVKTLSLSPYELQWPLDYETGNVGDDTNHP